jgi:hypothetical protein
MKTLVGSPEPSDGPVWGWSAGFPYDGREIVRHGISTSTNAAPMVMSNLIVTWRVSRLGC